MQTLQTFEGKEFLKDVSNSQLPTEDQIFCNTAFTIYSNHVSHVSELLNTIEKRNAEYGSTQQAKDDENFFSLNKIEKAREALKHTLHDLTQSLILKLENYFIKKYCLVFNSLLPDKGHTNLNPFSSYDPIIENITGQVGKNLLQAGKEQINKNFLRSFNRNSVPVLNGNKITIPNFITLDEHWGEKISLHYSYNSRLENLINALNLFLHDNTELPKQITDKLLEWKGALELSDYYPVFPGVSFKFFKNRRIDVFFSNAETAKKFWNYYTLEAIETIFQEND